VVQKYKIYVEQKSFLHDSAYFLTFEVSIRISVDKRAAENPKL
jgi:hypothetical protein